MERLGPSSIFCNPIYKKKGFALLFFDFVTEFFDFWLPSERHGNLYGFLFRLRSLKSRFFLFFRLQLFFLNG